MAEPASAIVGLVNQSWKILAYAREVLHARSDAKKLLERTNDLCSFLEKIDLNIRSHAEPLDKEFLSILQKALMSCNRTIEEISRRCLGLGDKEDLPTLSKIIHPVRFPLHAKSIQRFEQQLHTDILHVQLALYFLDREDKQQWIRRIETLIDQISRHIPSELEDTAKQKDLDDCVTVANRVLEESHDNQSSTFSYSPSHQQLLEGDTAPTSPIQTLAIKERVIWGETGEQLSHLVIERRQTNPAVKTELITAIAQHFPGKFQHLLDGVDLDGTDDHGYTLLMHTVYQHGKRCEECIKYMHKLLQHNINLDAKNNGETALYLSVEHNHLQVAKTLLDHGAKLDAFSPKNPLVLAVQRNRAHFVKLFLNSRPEVNIMDSDWSLIHHAIHYAIWENCTESLLVLLQQSKALGLDIDLDARSATGWTPLIYLAENAQCTESLHLATMLLENGADVNATDDSGFSALYYAATMGAPSLNRNKFVRLLIERGADVISVSKVPKQVINQFPAFRPKTSKS